MWLLQLLFFAVTFLLGWILFGYFLLCWFMGRFRGQTAPVFPDVWPSISVIVPCFNEAERIREKIEELRRLDYPRDRLEVVFADGGSTDGTVDLLRCGVAGERYMRVVACPRGGKIHQLNHVLPGLGGEIVVNTDADGRLAPDLLRWIAAEFEAGPDVWVVGAYCRPEKAVPIEEYYWSSQNKGRFLESDAGTSSIVIAQCYAFRRGLLAAFPEDVVADDIHIAFLASTLGYRTVYSRYAHAAETRSPLTTREFLPHKFRKSNAFLREALRFLYRLPEMRPFVKMMLLTRTGQLLLLPWIMLFWVLLCASLLALYQFDVVLIGILFVLLLFVATSRVFSWTDLPDGTRSHPLGTVVNGFVLTLIIMLVSGVSYPFFRQNSVYARLDVPVRGMDGDQEAPARADGAQREEGEPLPGVPEAVVGRDPTGTG